jgi:hypothetical protein
MAQSTKWKPPGCEPGRTFLVPLTIGVERPAVNLEIGSFARNGSGKALLSG